MSQRIKLTKGEIAALLSRYPNLPQDYLAYLQHVGWGESESGYMIYSAPLPPTEVYGPGFKPSSVVLLGDDFQGYCVGFDLLQGQYGEVSPVGGWQVGAINEGLVAQIGATNA